MRIVLPVLIALALISCERQKDPIVVDWNNAKAVSVSIKSSLLPSDTPDIRVAGSDYSVLGKTIVTSGIVLFIPDLPFERGQTYDIFSDNTKIETFSIPTDTTARPPVVLASFPSCDTVPENLLKIYIQFDQPMMEGRAYSFIHLIDKTSGDTLEAPFLDLQPELWSEDEKVLTLWLDPGRIKQDLIPNKKLGAVLTSGSEYQLLVSHGWRSKAGQALTSSYQRSFVTIRRDSGKPDVATWKVTTGNTIDVEIMESLDWSLLNSVMSVWRGDQMIEGKIDVRDCEKGFRFTPADALVPGTYRIQIESRLEDLAGNSLNRLFETDVTDASQISENKSVHSIAFTVQ